MIHLDRLFKVRLLIDLLHELCRRVYSPGENVIIEEYLVLCKERLHFLFKQFIRTKRARFGIKLYELATADGITLDFIAYYGHGAFDGGDTNADMPTTERIPVYFMHPFLNDFEFCIQTIFIPVPSLPNIF